VRRIRHGIVLAVGGDLYVSGNGTLVRAILADGLVDQLHLLISRSPADPIRASSPRERRAKNCRLWLVSRTRMAYLDYRPQA
jgi:hypothetical protein